VTNNNEGDAMRVLLTEIKRSIFDRKFFITVAATVIAALLGSWHEISAMKHNINLTENLGELSIRAAAASMQTDVFLLVIPILCVIPYAGSFAEDYQSRFLRAYLPLAGRRRYLLSKAFVTALAGGLALAAGLLVALAVCTAIYPPLGIPVGEYAFTYKLYFLALSFVFMGGALWAIVGGIAGAVLKNRYMVYAAPFIIYYVWASFQARYFRAAYAFNPQEWIRPAHINSPIVLLYAAIAAIIAFIIYYYAMKRRLRDV